MSRGHYGKSRASVGADGGGVTGLMDAVRNHELDPNRSPPPFTAMTRAETRLAEEARARQIAGTGKAGTIVDRHESWTDKIKTGWDTMPDSQRTMLKVGAAITGGVALTAVVLAVANRR